MTTESISEDLRRAVKLFNRWQFQEAYEAFVALAEEADGRDRAFLDGLSQLSAGFYRIWHKGGEANAMVSYLVKGIEILKPFARGGALGIEMEGIDARLAECLEEAMQWRRGDEEIFNRDIIPRLEFISGPVED